METINLYVWVWSPGNVGYEVGRRRVELALVPRAGDRVCLSDTDPDGHAIREVYLLDRNPVPICVIDDPYRPEFDDDDGGVASKLEGWESLGFKFNVIVRPRS